MSEPSTAKEKDALWDLLAEGGQGKGPPNAVRDALLAAGLVRAGFRGKLRLVEVTDAGWAWADRHLADTDASSAKPLRPWLKAIAAYLQAKGLALGEFFPHPPEPLTPTAVKQPAVKPSAAKPPAAKPLAKRTSGTAKTTVKASPTETLLRKRIREGYLAVTGDRLATRALLCDLRAALPDVDRATLDAALTKEHEKPRPTMRLMALDDPREMSRKVVDARITLRGQPLHLLWIIR